MPWLSRKDYETMLRRNDDRDFAGALREIERLRSDVRGLRTWLQRNLEALTSPPDEDEVADDTQDDTLIRPADVPWAKRQ